MSDQFTHYLVMSTKPGYWGRGKTVAAAIRAASYLGSGDEVRLFRATPDAHVHPMGYVNGVEAATRQIGKVARGGRALTGLRYEVPQE